MGDVTSIMPDNPEPPRPLGQEGRRLWAAIWGLNRNWIDRVIDIEYVAILCESMDERQFLRVKALRGDDWRDRVALRNLDSQIGLLMAQLGLNPTDRKTLNGGESGDTSSTSRLAILRATLGG